MISKFSAEICTISKALEQIKRLCCIQIYNFTDSLTCLQALHYMKLEHSMFGMVLFNLPNKYFFIIICLWVHSSRANERKEINVFI